MPKVLICSNKNFSSATGRRVARVFLVKKGFVGRASPLCDEEKFVFHPLGGIDIDLSGKVAAGIDLLVHVEGKVLGITQVFLGIGIIDPFGQALGIIYPGPNLLSLIGDNNGCAGILAKRKNAVGGYLRVFQQGHGHIAVVARSFGIVQNRGHHFQVLRPQKKSDIPHSGLGQHGERFRLNFQDGLALELGCFDVVRGQKGVFGLILTQGERLAIRKFGTGHTSGWLQWGR